MGHMEDRRGELRNSKKLRGSIRFFQPLRFWQSFLDRDKAQDSTLTFDLGLAKPRTLKTCGQELGDLRKVCDLDTA